MSRNCKVNEFDINTKYHGSHLGGGGEGGKIKLLVVLEFIFVTTFIITQPTTVQHCCCLRNPNKSETRNMSN